MSTSTEPVSTGAVGAPIELPGAPAIQGLAFRHYAGPQDHAALVHVTNAQFAAAHESRVETVEELDNNFAHPVNMDPYRDVIVATVHGAIVGWGRVEWVDQNWGGRAYETWGAVDPAWMRRGIGQALLRWNERRLRELNADHAYDGPRWFGTWGSDTNPGLVALMGHEGYVPVRQFFLMVRPNLDDIVDMPLPDGLEVRPVGPQHFRQLFDADIDAFRDHWGGIEDSDENFRQWSEAPKFDPSLFVIAWGGDEIAGGVVNGIYTEENERLGVRRGFLDQVFTRRAWRRRGLARALIARSLVLLRDRGMTSAALGVDASNPNAALPLYESCGFAPAERDTAYRKAWDPAKGREWEGLDEPAL